MTELTPATVESTVTHGPDWHERRRQGIGGSDANVLANGTPEDVDKLYRVKIGEQEPDDLTGKLQVMLGAWTEPLNAWWFQRQTGRSVTDKGRTEQHADHPFMLASLDGLTTTQGGAPAYFEAKHVNAWSKPEDVAQRYMPQLHHVMAVMGLDHAVLSLLIGTDKWDVFEVAADPFYTADLIEREAQFWRSVETKTPPHDLPVAPEAPPISEYRTVSMEGDNQWADAAARWIETKDAAKRHKTAHDELRNMIPADVGHAEGHGMLAKRDRRGRLTLKESTQ
jgi:predicted phage-related endonuclease